MNDKPERATRQKELIQTVFSEAGRPLSAAEAYQLAVLQQPGLGIATVYRTINRLVEGGRLRPLAIPSVGTCFELTNLPEHHGHFVCIQCHRVFELAHEIQTEAPPLPPGFKVQHVDVLVQGNCSECNPTA